MATILVVEDDQAVRALICHALTRAGYDVLAAGDGDEAIRLHSLHFPDLLVIDAVLPKQSGMDVVRRCRSTRPDLPALFISGYSLHELQQKGIPGEAILPKPFSIQDLFARVIELLSGNGGR